jgi:hypothetical protein
MSSDEIIFVSANEINKEHSAAIGAAETAIRHGLECGRLLTKAKAKFPHGNWEQWVSTS